MAIRKIFEDYQGSELEVFKNAHKKCAFKVEDKLQDCEIVLAFDLEDLSDIIAELQFIKKDMENDEWE